MRGRVTRDEISCSKMTGRAYGKIIAHKFVDFEENLAALQLLNVLNKAQWCSADASGIAMLQMMAAKAQHPIWRRPLFRNQRRHGEF
jgi:hypothetical protein